MRQALKQDFTDFIPLTLVTTPEVWVIIPISQVRKTEIKQLVQSHFLALKKNEFAFPLCRPPTNHIY